MAQGLETGSFGKRPRIGITALGSEHGEDTVAQGAVMAAREGVDVVLIGTAKREGVETIEVDCESAAHEKMEELLKSGYIDGAVTMHYPFPIGVSTVGRATTPALGRELFIATTTGTSSADRTEGMIKNAIGGIIAAKSCGIATPTVGILNIDGARQTEMALKQLIQNGYEMTLASSKRSDGGCIFRGNDVLTGAADVLVCDPLTGNVLIKMLSAFTSGGNYETVGCGYGPGIGEGYETLVLIISRASGAPLICGALKYASELAKGKVFEVAKSEYAAAHKAGLSGILSARRQPKPAEVEEEVKAPPAEVVTAQISGIEIMDLEEGVQTLWKEGVYAQSGMGCTGPIILVSEENLHKSKAILEKAGYIAQ